MGFFTEYRKKIEAPANPLQVAEIEQLVVDTIQLINHDVRHGILTENDLLPCDLSVIASGWRSYAVKAELIPNADDPIENAEKSPILSAFLAIMDMAVERYNTFSRNFNMMNKIIRNINIPYFAEKNATPQEKLYFNPEDEICQRVMKEYVETITKIAEESGIDFRYRETDNAPELCTVADYDYALMQYGVREKPFTVADILKDYDNQDILDAFIECYTELMPSIYIYDEEVFSLHTSPTFVKCLYEKCLMMRLPTTPSDRHYLRLFQPTEEQIKAENQRRAQIAREEAKKREQARKAAEAQAKLDRKNAIREAKLLKKQQKKAEAEARQAAKRAKAKKQ